VLTRLLLLLFLSLKLKFSFLGGRSQTLATSVGDPTILPTSPSQPAVVHQETLVLGEPTQEAPKVPMP
jgi:hypothetical protein